MNPNQKISFKKGNVKVKILSLAFFLTIFSATAYGQLTVQYKNSIFNKYTKENLWDWAIVNSGSTSVTVFFIIELNASGNNTIVKVKSQPFTLEKGLLHNIAYFQYSSEYIYNDSPFVEEFRVSGSLPPGEYTICLSMFSNEGQLSVNNCFPVRVHELVGLRLIQPFDEEKLKTFYPLFSWTPVFNQKDISYHVTLSPILSGQTKIEALANNPLFINENVFQTTMSYPASASKLEANKKYSWQVHALSKENIVASSEVWAFEINDNTIPMTVFEDCYRLVQKNQTAAPYINKGVLMFAYENRSNQKELNYKMINVSDGNVLRTLKVIPLRNGINQISINLNEIASVKKETQYLLEIMDAYNQNYRLKFKYN